MMKMYNLLSNHFLKINRERERERERERKRARERERERERGTLTCTCKSFLLYQNIYNVTKLVLFICYYLKLFGYLVLTLFKSLHDVFISAILLL